MPTLIQKLHRTLDIADLVVLAIRSQRGHLLESFFGPKDTWFPPYDEDSEFNILDPWQPLRALKYLTEISVPAFSEAPGPWARTLLPPAVQRLFWRPSICFNEPDPFGHPASHPEERWFFINGIGTNLDVARMNTRKLAKVYQRPITGIYNPTCSVLLDLWECLDGMVDKTEPIFDEPASMTAPDYVAAHAVFAALADESVKRVVLIAHSQGTIIAANVLKALLSVVETLSAEGFEQPARNQCAVHDGKVCLREMAYRKVIPDFIRGQEQGCQIERMIRALAKLEFHMYATCAREVRFMDVEIPSIGESARLPRIIRHYANEWDVIAQMGMLGFDKGRLEGDSQIRKDGVGNLLNASYCCVHLKQEKF